MIERAKAYIHTHSYAGRREQYLHRHEHLLDQTKGEVRYMFEKDLLRDAKRYARKKVVMDILSVAVVSSAATVIGIELKRGTLKEDALKVWTDLKHGPQMVQNAWDGFIRKTGEQFGNGVAVGVVAHMPDIRAAAEPLAEDLGARAAYGAVKGLGMSLPGFAEELGILIEIKVMETVSRVAGLFGAKAAGTGKS